MGAPFEKRKDTISMGLEGVCDALKQYIMRKQPDNEEHAQTNSYGRR